MSVRRNRRYALVLWLLAMLLMSGSGVCRADDLAEDFTPSGAAAPQLTSRPQPFYGEVAPDVPAGPNRSQRISPSRKNAAAPPSKGQESPASLEIVGKLDTTALTKTPLPGVSDPGDINQAAVDEAALEAASARTGRSGFGSSVIWAIGILAVGWIVRQFLKASGQLSFGAPSVLEVLSRQSIGPQHQLTLIRFGPRVLLIGTTPTGMSTLATVEDPAEVEAIVTELRPASAKGGPTLFDLFRPRPTEMSRGAAAVNVTLSTDGRSARAHQEAINKPDAEQTPMSISSGPRGPDSDPAQRLLNRSHQERHPSPVQNREVADV